MSAPVAHQERTTHWQGFLTELGVATGAGPEFADFVVSGRNGFAVCVIDGLAAGQDDAALEAIEGTARREVWVRDVLVVDRATWHLDEAPVWDQFLVAGWLGEYVSTDDSAGGEASWAWGKAAFAYCTGCYQVAFFHEYQSFACRPNGCHDSGGNFLELERQDLVTAWHRAGSVG